MNVRNKTLTINSIIYKIYEKKIKAFTLSTHKVTDCQRDYPTMYLRKKIHIGEIETETDNNQTWLSEIYVEKKYRCKGIATKLIQLALEYLGLNAIPCVREHPSYYLYLTDLGEKLIAECLIKGIVKPEMCYFSSSMPNYYSDFILNEEHVDPQLDSYTVIIAYNRCCQPKTISNSVPNFIKL